MRLGVRLGHLVTSCVCLGHLVASWAPVRRGKAANHAKERAGSWFTRGERQGSKAHARGEEKPASFAIWSWGLARRRQGRVA